MVMMFRGFADAIMMKPTGTFASAGEAGFYHLITRSDFYRTRRYHDFLHGNGFRCRSDEPCCTFTNGARDGSIPKLWSSGSLSSVYCLSISSLGIGEFANKVSLAHPPGSGLGVQSWGRGSTIDMEFTDIRYWYALTGVNFFATILRMRPRHDNDEKCQCSHGLHYVLTY